MIKGVVFDLDHTLYDRDASSRAAMSRFFDEYPEYVVPGVSRAQAQEAVVGAEHACIYGGWRAVAARLRDTGILQGDFTARFIVDYFQTQYAENMARFPFVRPALERLQRMGMKLGLITNGNPRHQTAKIAALGEADRFDEIIIGSDPATAKPHVDLFLDMAERLRCLPCELIYAGDNPVNDVDASRRAGYVAVWVRTITPWQFPDIPQPEWQVDTVADIPSLVERLNAGA
ncbi:MAG: HAD family hydrolase [Clostridia bacterium]|nr:HAD family hydrolase [Clostridia bacterium]